MPLLGHSTHTRANMFGLATHAQQYERVAALLARPLYRRVAADVSGAHLSKGSVVLDVGTGPGILPRMIAAQSPGLSVVGVDLSPDMVARATSTTASDPSLGSERVRFEVADAAALPFSDQSVDLVISSLSLHHWDDPAAGLADITRVLSPNGQAWIYDVRRTLRRVAGQVAVFDAEVRLELPLTRTCALNPIGRLVLRPRLG